MLDTSPIDSGAAYIESLRGRGLRVFFMGERVSEPVDHPVIRPSINAVARTYDLANEDPDLATAHVTALQPGGGHFPPSTQMGALLLPMPGQHAAPAVHVWQGHMVHGVAGT